MRNTIAVIFAPLFTFLVLFPLASLVGNIEISGLQAIFADEYFWDSFRNTVVAAAAASTLCLVLATGFGYCHIFLRDTILYKIANAMNELPVSLPHTVAGLALLLAFGRNNFSFVGPTGLAFSMTAVIISMFFVSYPLAARTLASAADNMPREVIDVARTLGDSPAKAYIRVTLPCLGEALMSAFVISFARSISEFAAVILFGGNLPGSTQVLASYVFSKVEEGELAMAVAASAFCLAFSVIVLGIAYLIRRRQKNA